jgi:hypothetical protein
MKSESKIVENSELMSQFFSIIANRTAEKVSGYQPFDGCQDFDLCVSDNKPEQQKSFEKKTKVVQFSPIT